METVLITGIGRGIGYQLAADFLQQGYKVIGTVRNQASLEKLTSLSKRYGDSLDICMLEVTESSSVNDLATVLAGQTIDILINCAGVLGGDHQAYNDMDFDMWAETFAINTMAPMKIAMAFVPNLRQSESPKIVSISSIMGSLARERSDQIAYRSSKAALNKTMQCLANALEPENIGVYLMHPGWVRTDMGGNNADISVEESSAGLVKQITSFTMEQSGRFWQYDGQELEW